jgi:hypothetical protein
MRPNAFRLGLALAPLVAASPAAAQIMSNPAQWYINNQIYSTRVFNGVVANSMLGKTGKGDARAGADKSGNAGPAADPTAFRETPGFSLSKVLAGRASANGQSPQQAQRMFESYVALYKQTAEKDGFPSNDLAYAFEYFVVNNYHIVHDLMDVPYEKDPRAKRGKDGFERITIMSEKKLLQVTIPQERAIYDQFRESLGKNPEILRMTDAQKQEAAELMAIMFGVNYAAYMNGINAENEAATEQARQMARQGLEKLLGVPVGRIRVTNSGLEL